MLLRHQAPVEQRTADGWTALHLASAEGQLVSVDFLMSAKADINYKDRWGGTALDDALSAGHYECAKILIGFGGQATKAITAVQQQQIDQMTFFDVRERIRKEELVIQERRRVLIQLKGMVKALQPDLDTALHKTLRLTKLLGELTSRLLHKAGQEALITAANLTDEQLFKLPTTQGLDDDDAYNVIADGFEN